MFSFTEIPEDCVCLKEGDVLLTSSSQLAVDWKQRLIMASGYEVCETPVVLAWQTWLVEIAAEVDLMPVALNRVQEGWLWEQVIRDDLAQHTDVARQTEASVRGLAKHARDAYALMQEYCIDAVELHFAGDEADALLRWIDAIHQSLAEGALVGRMLLADIASQVIQNPGQSHLNHASLINSDFKYSLSHPAFRRLFLMPIFEVLSALIKFNEICLITAMFAALLPFRVR